MLLPKTGKSLWTAYASLSSYCIWNSLTCMNSKTLTVNFHTQFIKESDKEMHPFSDKRSIMNMFAHACSTFQKTIFQRPRGREPNKCFAHSVQVFRNLPSSTWIPSIYSLHNLQFYTTFRGDFGFFSQLILGTSIFAFLHEI